MSKSLSITIVIDDADLREVEEAANTLHVDRNTFIVQAVRLHACHVSRGKLQNQLQMESTLTAKESLRVLGEFEAL